MADEKFKLFREKSLESIESPESLTDYLRVTSPRVWMLLGAVMLILIGIIVWGIAGSIETHAKVAVMVNEEGGVCYISASAIESAIAKSTITVDGTTCALYFDGMQADVVTQDTDVRVRLNGGFSYGDIIYIVKLGSTLDTGSYAGELETDSLKPISLLFR